MKKTKLQNASFGKRLGAWLFDCIFIEFAILFPVFLVMTLAFQYYDENVYKIIIASVEGAYYLFKDVFKGRSLGKLVFGLYVRDYYDLNKIPKFYKLILRNILFVNPVDYILIFCNNGRRLGDIIAKTQVVQYEK